MPASSQPSTHTEEAELRRALGRITTSVAVVTADTGDGPVGMTIGSLAAVSHDPPLVVFFARASSYTFTALRDAENFCINVLAEGHDDVAMGFAARDGVKFGVGRWTRCCSTAPRMLGCATWLECTRESVFDAGDHVAMMGRIRHLGYTDKRPLTFHRGKLARLHPATHRSARTARLDWWSL